MSKGFQLPSDGHVVVLIPPKDITGGATGLIFNLKNANRVQILIAIGVSAAAPSAVTVSACTDESGDSPVAIAFDLYKQESANGDVYGDRVPTTSAGFTPVATDNISYVIDIDAATLPNGSPYLKLSMANTSNSVIASAIAILSGLRFARVSNPTAIT